MQLFKTFLGPCDKVLKSPERLKDLFQGMKTSNAHDFHQKTKTLQNFVNFVISVSLFHRFIPYLLLFWSKQVLRTFDQASHKSREGR